MTRALVVLLTRQGVRDLGGNRRVRIPDPRPGCSHLWESFIDWDCDYDLMPGGPVRTRRKRCGFCHEVM